MASGADLQNLLDAHRALAGPEGEQRLLAWLAQEVASVAKRLGLRQDDETRSAAPGEKPSRQVEPPRSQPSTTSPGATPPKSPLLTPDEVSRILGHKKKTLANWRAKKIGPRWYRYGGRIHYRQSDIDNWIEGSKSEPDDE
jgi:predicted DNA-binding transcriptional regulator AlpA